MLKIFASLVIAFFVALYASGNNIETIKYTIVHWANQSAQATGTDQSDWGTA